MIYLASPYSVPSINVQRRRYNATLAMTARLIHDGFHIFSPIVHCHAMAERYKLPTHAEFWLKYNTAMLDAAEAIWVAMLPGWESSKGVCKELEMAGKVAKPYRFVQPNNEELALLQQD